MAFLLNLGISVFLANFNL